MVQSCKERQVRSFRGVGSHCAIIRLSVIMTAADEKEAAGGYGEEDVPCFIVALSFFTLLHIDNVLRGDPDRSCRRFIFCY